LESWTCITKALGMPPIWSQANYIVGIHLGWLHLKARRLPQLRTLSQLGRGCKTWWLDETSNYKCTKFQLEVRTLAICQNEVNGFTTSCAI
jgi:hypothetical protein